MATRPDSRQVVLRSTQSMLGTSANDTLDTIFPKINDEIAKLFEDKNVMLQNGGLITFTGTQIDFTENLEIAINGKIAGGAPTVISLGSTSRTLSTTGRMLYAVVDRSLGTATVTSDATTLPAVNSSNQEVFLIAKRVDASDGTQRVYWRNGMGQNAGQTLRLGASGTGGGGGLGDDIITTQFQASFTDEFDESASMSSSAVDSTKTNATYSSSKALYRLSYDASKTVSTSGPIATISSTPSFTVAAGDILISGGVAKRITSVASLTYTLESAFASNLSSAPCTVSQAVHTKDIYGTAFDGVSISSAFSTPFSEILVDYEDTTTLNDNIFDLGTAPVVGFSASADNSNWSTAQVRPTLTSTKLDTLNLPTSGTALYIRFFANKSSGSGAVNILKYKAYAQKLSVNSAGGAINSAYAFTDSSATPVRCTVGTLSGKTSITLNWQYPVGINAGDPYGSVDVYLDGKLIPRYINATLTPDASYTEVSPTVILLDSNYSSVNVSVEIVQRTVYVDHSSQNSSNIAAIQTTLSLVPTITRITSSGTYVPSTGVKYTKVKMVGGGGAGGAQGTDAGGGGGGGGYLEFIINNPSGSYPYVIGTGGVGVASNNGGDGVDTTFTNPSAVTNIAAGGKGGKSGGTQAGGIGGSFTLTFGSGFGSVGQGGGSGGGGTGATFYNCGGTGGSSMLGGGANGPAYNAAGVSATSNTGGGGSGSSKGATAGTKGGDGGSGVIIIEEYYV